MERFARLAPSKGKAIIEDVRRPKGFFDLLDVRFGGARRKGNLTPLHRICSLSRGRSLERLVRCGRSLGLKLGWRYWRIHNRALMNPWLVLEWADNCDREAERLDAMNEGLLANAHRQWAEELRTTYDRWKAPNNKLGNERA